jgi:hypothetical protein
MCSSVRITKNDDQAERASDKGIIVPNAAIKSIKFNARDKAANEASLPINTDLESSKNNRLTGA